MKTLPFSPYTRVLTAFTAFLFLFLIAMDMFLIRSDRNLRIASVQEYAEEEIDLIGTYVTESMLRLDLATVEQFIRQWGEKDPDVISLTAATPEGRVLVRFEKPTSGEHTLTLRHAVTYREHHLLDLEMVEDLGDIYDELASLSRQLILRSVVVVVFFGIISWYIFRVFGLKPMEREILLRKRAERKLTQAKDGLERAVRERTGELESANVRLTKEVEERKAAEELAKASLKEKEILLQEIHHRVKNNLQVVSGLLEIQLSRGGGEKIADLLKESQSRIRSMALVHEELYRSEDLEKIDFSHYVRSLTQSLHQSYVQDPEKVLIHFDLEPVPLVVDTVIPCGLILNELLTNTFKHAFPEGRMGEVTVAFHPAGEDSYRLSVRDNGVGLPPEFNPVGSESLGLKLVSVLVDQLHGEIEVENNDGTRFDITFQEYREAGTAMY